MAGAVVGSAIRFQVSQRSRKTVGVLGVTINDACQLRCRHCYLETGGPSAVRYLSPQAEAFIAASDFGHLAVIGKEPLFDDRSVAILTSLAALAHRKEATFSFITNGLGLKRLPYEIAQGLAFIDISIDGGPESYQKHRGAKYAVLKRSIVEFASRFPQLPLHGLCTLYEGNAGDIEDIMVAMEELGFRMVMFSPFVPTERIVGGAYAVQQRTLLGILQALATSRRFREHPNAQLLIDPYHGVYDTSVRLDDVMREAARCGLERHVTVIHEDPFDLGIVRVTFDGKVMGPFDALHTIRYAAMSEASVFSNAETWWEQEHKRRQRSL